MKDSKERHTWLHCRLMCQVNTRGHVRRCAPRRCDVSLRCSQLCSRVCLVSAALRQVRCVLHALDFSFCGQEQWSQLTPLPKGVSMHSSRPVLVDLPKSRERVPRLHFSPSAPLHSDCPVGSSQTRISLEVSQPVWPEK